MSIYTTPLQFGYFFAILFALLFWHRGWKEERFSDALLGFIMFFLGMEIQDYTFGFAGINFLWEELNGFPRYFGFAFAPTIYFYLRAQINRNFKFGKREYLQYLPYMLYFAINLSVFLSGEDFVNKFNESVLGYIIGYVEKIGFYIIYIIYFYLSLKLYKSYRHWAETEYSDTETISFVWLRNFIYLIIAGTTFKFLWFVIDSAFGDLSYYQDWWWHLLTVFIICYVGIKGYSQKQVHKINFSGPFSEKSDPDVFHFIRKNSKPEEKVQAGLLNDSKEISYEQHKSKIDNIFHKEKIYLDSDLSLSELSKKLKSNNSIISAAINTLYGKNFNDFVNEFRVNEYKSLVKSDHTKNLTLYAIAMECGFNSKATFNRAVKKNTGFSPKEIFDQAKTVVNSSIL